MTSTGGSETESTAADERKARQELLLKVYETTVGEYRFNVQQNWDRTKFFLLLSLTAIAAGVGLLRVALDNAVICLFLAAYFFLLLLLTRFGAQTQKAGKSYIRQAQLTMTLAQRELGLYNQLKDFGAKDLNLGFAVTPSQRDPVGIIFNRTNRLKKKPDKGSIVSSIEGIFQIITLIEGLGVAICLGAAAPGAMWTTLHEGATMSFDHVAIYASGLLRALLPAC